MILECPQCKTRIGFPSPKQIEAYRHTYIHGLTQEEAAAEMGISQPAICKLLRSLKAIRPDLFETDDLPTLNNTRTWDFASIDETKVRRKW